MQAVVQLLSGGFDSVGQALLLQEQGFIIHPLYIKFRLGGGKQGKELQIVHDISVQQQFEVPHIISHRINKKDYSCRNRTLCVLAESYALSIGLTAVAIGTPTGGVNLGDVNDDDINVKVLEANIGLKLHTMGMYKSEIIKKLPPYKQRLLFQTTSCQLWFKEECGRCYICVERHAAFITALGYDHTAYINDPKASMYWKPLIRQEQHAYEGLEG